MKSFSDEIIFRFAHNSLKKLFETKLFTQVTEWIATHIIVTIILSLIYIDIVIRLLPIQQAVILVMAIPMLYLIMLFKMIISREY